MFKTLLTRSIIVNFKTGTNEYTKPYIGSVYQHYKGPLYQVTNVATHTETGQKLVVYHSLKNPEKVWARPVEMWNEHVDINGELAPRFELVDAVLPNQTTAKKVL